MTEKLVILAGGISSRMKKSASQAPIDGRLERDADRKAKAMIGVGERQRPLMDFLLFNARESGYGDIVIVIGEGDTSVRTHYGGRDRGNLYHGLNVSYAVQRIPEGRTKPLGTADALLRALRSRPDWQESRFTVCNSDNIYSVAALTALRLLPSSGGMIGYDRAALKFAQSRIEQFAVVRKDRDGYLAEIIEKPEPADILAAMDAGGNVAVSMNVWRLSCKQVVPYLESVPLHPVRMEKELPVAIRMLIRDHPRAIRVIPLAEEVPDLTSKDDITTVQQYLRTHFTPSLWDEEDAQTNHGSAPEPQGDTDAQ